MKVTDKAKTDFEYYIYSNDKVSSTTNDYGWSVDSFYKLNPTLQNALIIEWLDSVGLYISTDIDYNYRYFRYKIDSRNSGEGSDYAYTSRHGAINKAIEIANSIYNGDK